MSGDGFARDSEKVDTNIEYKQPKMAMHIRK